MVRASILFLAGTLATGSLFQFDLGLPSFYSKQHIAQKAKIDSAKDTVRKRRANLSRKSLKSASRKAAGSLLPFVGTVVTLGLAAEDYCNELEGIIELQNILEGRDEQFDFETCLSEAKAFVRSQFE